MCSPALYLRVDACFVDGVDDDTDDGQEDEVAQPLPLGLPVATARVVVAWIKLFIY